MARRAIVATFLLSAVVAVNGQFLHFPVQSGRPDSGQNTPPVAPPVARTVARTVAEEVDEDYNEVQSVPERINRGRGRTRVPERSRESSRPSNRGTGNQPASRAPVRKSEVTLQRRPDVTPQRRPETTLQRRPEITPQRRPLEPSQRRPEPAAMRRPESTTSQAPIRQRIRIKRPETRPEETPVVRQRQRIQVPTTESAQAVVIPTTPPPTPPPTTPPTTPRVATTTTTTVESKQTFDGSVSGLFDPNSLTVFGVNREQPRFLPPPQPQFKIPEVTPMRKLPEPRVIAINEVKDIPEFSNVRNLPEPRIVQPKIQNLEVKQKPRLIATSQPVRNVPVPELQQSPERDQPFMFFPAKPQTQSTQPQQIPQRAVPTQPQQIPQRVVPTQPPPSPQRVQRPVQTRPQPIPFQSQPRPQQPSLAAPLNNFQPQPVLRQQSNFQTRPSLPASPQQSQSVQVVRESFFQEGQPLFSQPIEIPTNANGGASFSYEAVVG